MKKVIAIFLVFISIALVNACGASRRSNEVRKENTSTIMDSGAQMKPPAVIDSTKQ